ncbi:hypothetical protein D9611_006112 [Ephemerocybe angulata]|uniref:Uncharacterized protein n=1 Tax=Ephemerocybe angulata TaxID=980116 RepID=A0A8H5CHR9_9AGAR|nr:hypothetical protein D9611_006112 [Tulosesus angulatus]
MSGRWPRKVITDELLSRASQGSPADLFSVCKALIDGEFTPEVVQLPALFLRADLIPRVEQQDPQEIQDRMKRAATSISMLASILRAAKEEPDIVEGLIAWALESVDGICGWARLLLIVPDVDPYWKDDLVAAHYRSAAALNLLLHLDPKVYGAFISSNVFIDLAIQVWVREGPEKELLMGAENGSVIPPFLSYCLSKKEGVEALAERLIDRRLTERFVSAVVRRMRQASLVNLSSTTPEQISEYVTYINTMTARLHGFKNDTIQKAFRTTNCIKNVFSSLNDLSIVLERHAPKKLPLLAVPIFTLTAITVFERTRAVQNWRDFIAGNLLSMLSRVAPAIPQSDVKNTKIICSTLRNLSACAYFPVFLATLSEAVPSGRVECPPLCNETIDYWWGRQIIGTPSRPVPVYTRCPCRDLR